jgi:hypothetical protein
MTAIHTNVLDDSFSNLAKDITTYLLLKNPSASELVQDVSMAKNVFDVLLAFKSDEDLTNQMFRSYWLGLFEDQYGWEWRHL